MASPTAPVSSRVTALALLGCLLLDGAVVASGVLAPGPWRTAARVVLMLDALLLGYWLLLRPRVARWLQRSPY